MTENMTIMLIIGFVVAVAAVTAFAFYSRKRKSEHLKLRFGPEYDRMVALEGAPGKAEERLEKREKRVEKLALHPVPPELRDRFARSWAQVQTRFVDEPGAAVTEADALVRKVMESRGYPMGTFEERAADISVDHPLVVQNYRSARDIALKRERGDASTEELRQAFVHYRALFSELLEVKVAQLEEVAAR